MRKCMRHRGVGMSKNKLKRILSLFTTVIKVKPHVFTFEYLMMFVDAVATAALLPALSNFFAALRELIADNWQNQGALTKSLLYLFAIYVLAETASGLTNYCGEIYSNLSVRGLREKFHRDLKLLPTLSTENNKIMETVEGAYFANYDVRALLNTLMDFGVFYLPYFVTYAFYLYRMDAKLLLLLPCLFLPLLAAQFFKAKLVLAYEQELGQSRRLEDAYTSYLQTPDVVRELRSLGADQFFGHRYAALQVKIRSLLQARGIKSCLYNWAGELLHLFFYIAIFALLLWTYVKGEVAVHELAAIFMTLLTVRNLASEFINVRIGEVTENYGLIERCLDLPDHLTLQEQDLPKSLQVANEAAVVFEDVTFTYPGNSKAAVEHVSFSLHKGETLALVGANGSGKTTLSALFLGLYAPDTGKIYRNGKLLTAADERQAATANSAVFQHFNRYRRTVRENLQFALTGGDASTATADSDQRLIDLLAELQLMADKDLPAGLDSYLDPAFGGIDLSGGQWQKLALARAKLKEASYISLDEPTAALDPLFETQVYNYLLELAHAKVGLLVTHRLALAKQCDKIMLLQDGKVAAYDTHANLLLSSPLYREMWESQASTY